MGVCIYICVILIYICILLFILEVFIKRKVFVIKSDYCDVYIYFLNLLNLKMYKYVCICIDW